MGVLGLGGAGVHPPRRRAVRGQEAAPGSVPRRRVARTPIMACQAAQMASSSSEAQQRRGGPRGGVPSDGSAGQATRGGRRAHAAAGGIDHDVSTPVRARASRAVRPRPGDGAWKAGFASSSRTCGSTDRVRSVPCRGGGSSVSLRGADTAARSRTVGVAAACSNYLTVRESRRGRRRSGLRVRRRAFPRVGASCLASDHLPLE